MRLIFVGPQGSGKGTQADIISKKLGIAHISTGDLLRNIGGGLKEEVDSYIDHGNLVPDDLILRILNERIMQKDFSPYSAHNGRKEYRKRKTRRKIEYFKGQ